MAESDEGILNVAGHGKMYLALVVVPVECESEVSCAFPASVDFIVLLDDARKMVDNIFVYLIQTKIADNEGEADGALVMLPVS